MHSRHGKTMAGFAWLPVAGCGEPPDTAAIPTIDSMNNIPPPVAAIRPYQVTSPHRDRTDDYYWLRDDNREDPDVLAYLAAENAYTTAQLGPLKEVEEQVFDGLTGRMKKDDSTVPARHRVYWYYKRYQGGQRVPDLWIPQGLG